MSGWMTSTQKVKTMSNEQYLKREPWQVGMVVLASVSNPLENPQCTGKIRPVVLVERVCGHWRVMGLTTNPRYRTGLARVAVPDPAHVGLRGPGYLWGRNLTSICALELERPIGWCDPELAEAVADLAQLPRSLRSELEAAAERWNPMPPLAA